MDRNCNPFGKVRLNERSFNKKNVECKIWNDKYYVYIECSESFEIIAYDLTKIAYNKAVGKAISYFMACYGLDY